MTNKLSQEIEGIMKLSKLTSEDVKTNYITGIQCEELGGLELTGSWQELMIALLVLLYIRNPKKFITRLFDAKIADRDFEVTPESFVKHTEKETIEPMKIIGTPYYLYYDFSYLTLPFKIKALIIMLDANPKKVSIAITPYSYVDQDEGFFEFKKGQLVKKMKLTETARVNFNNNKMVAVNVFGYKEKCRTYTQLLAIILSYVAKIAPDWFDRITPYNKDNTLKVVRSKEEAVIYGEEAKEISGTNCYVNQRINAENIMIYLRDICKEFGINTDKIILYCKDKDFSQVRSGVFY